MINPMTIIQMLPILQGNPAGMLMNRGFNVPQNHMDGPQAIIQHLMNSGQIDQATYNNAIKTAQSMGYNI